MLQVKSSDFSLMEYFFIVNNKREPRSPGWSHKRVYARLRRATAKIRVTPATWQHCPRIFAVAPMRATAAANGRT